MTRTILSFFVSCLVLVAGGATAWLQSRNFDRAARLDRMQIVSEWHERRKTQLREQLERFEFEAELLETAHISERVSRGAE